MTFPASKIQSWVDQLCVFPRKDEFTINRILREIDAAIKSGRHEDMGGLYTARGVALAQLGREAESLSAHRTARRLAPNDFDTSFNMGVTLCHFGRTTEALESYEAAMNTPGGYNMELLGALAVTLANIGESDEAHKAMAEALRLSQDASGDQLIVVAGHAAHIGLFGEAVEALAKGVLTKLGRPRTIGDALEVLDAERATVEPVLERNEVLAHAVAQVRAWQGRFTELAVSIAGLPPRTAQTANGDDITHEEAFEATSGLRARANAAVAEDINHD